MQVDFLVLERAPQSFGEDVVAGASTSIHANFDLFALQAFQIFRAGEMTALVAVPDFRLGLRQGVIHSGEHKIHLQSLAERPADDIPGIPVQHGGQVQPAMCQADVGNVNGLITNDKFCMIRWAKLRLRAQPSYPLCYHPMHQADRRYPSDETFHPGGNHETPMVCSPRTQTLSGWTTTLGSRLSVPPAMDPQLNADGEFFIDEDDLGSTSGGAT